MHDPFLCCLFFLVFFLFFNFCTKPVCARCVCNHGLYLVCRNMKWVVLLAVILVCDSCVLLCFVEAQYVLLFIIVCTFNIFVFT